MVTHLWRNVLWQLLVVGVARTNHICWTRVCSCTNRSPDNIKVKTAVPMSRSLSWLCNYSLSECTWGCLIRPSGKPHERILKHFFRPNFKVNFVPILCQGLHMPNFKKTKSVPTPPLHTIPALGSLSTVSAQCHQPRQAKWCVPPVSSMMVSAHLKLCWPQCRGSVQGTGGNVSCLIQMP